MNSICQSCHKPFALIPEAARFYTERQLPLPTFCPQCRLQRRLTWRNEHSLYQRSCDLCHKTVISIYRPDSPYKVYCQECWWSDRWDPLIYARDYDWSKDFFTQYHELRQVVPRVALTNTNSENSDYTNYAGNNKNCYLMFANAYGNNENCAYGVGTRKCHNCYDTLNLSDSELVYDAADSSFCHRVVGAVNCQSCTECWFIEDCSNCQHCIGCKGLRNKQYHIFNQAYSPEEYAVKLKALQLDTPLGLAALQQRWAEFRTTVSSRYSHQLKSENCTGDYITNSANCTVCFDVNETERSAYIKFSIGQVRECFDVSYTGTAELSYEAVSLVDAYHCRFTNITWWSVRDLEYCELCFNTSNCFGSISLRKQQYCILNKPYSPTAYQAMVERIKQHMNEKPYQDNAGRVYRYGEFPPAEHSPFTYVESVAEDFFPTQTPTARGTSSTTVTQSVGIRMCQRCTKAFKLIPAELEFYTAMNLPPPALCFNCRHQQRLRHKSGVELWPRQCQCQQLDHEHAARCATQFETTYRAQRPEVVYCADCYQKTIY